MNKVNSQPLKENRKHLMLALLFHWPGFNCFQKTLNGYQLWFTIRPRTMPTAISEAKTTTIFEDVGMERVFLIEQVEIFPDDLREVRTCCCTLRRRRRVPQWTQFFGYAWKMLVYLVAWSANLRGQQRTPEFNGNRGYSNAHSGGYLHDRSLERNRGHLPSQFCHVSGFARYLHDHRARVHLVDLMVVDKLIL